MERAWERVRLSLPDYGDDMRKTKILILLSSGGVRFLQTREECGRNTLFKAERLNYRVVSRNDSGITQSLTEREYATKDAAVAAAEGAGCATRSPQAIAAEWRREFGESEFEDKVKVMG